MLLQLHKDSFGDQPGAWIFSWHLSLSQTDENNALPLNTVCLTGMTKKFDLVWKQYSDDGISISTTLGGFVEIKSFSCIILWIPLDFINFKLRLYSWQHHAWNSKPVWMLD